jgi:hypothetical protein
MIFASQLSYNIVIYSQQLIHVSYSTERIL